MNLFRHYSFAQRPPNTLGPQNAMHDATLELNLVAAGQEWVRIDEDDAFAQGANEVVVIPPGTVHSSWSGAQPASFHCLHLCARTLAEVGEELRTHVFQRPAASAIAAPARWAFGALHRELMVDASLPGTQLSRDALALNLVVQLARPTMSRKLRSGSPLRSLARVDELLRSSPEADHSLTELAQLAGLSTFHFVRAYKRAYGITPHQQLLALRVARAAELMRQPGLTLTQIAYDVGFGSSSRLTEAFKRRHGVSPSQWRRAHHRSALSL